MFGEAAIQHAPKGSYPRYFQLVFEKGLTRPDYSSNPFLHHIFLDQFLEIPAYLTNPPETQDVNLLTGGIDQVKSLSTFDLIQLSNIFDWSSESDIRTTCRRLSDEMKAGSILLLRQINNDSPLADYLGPQFEIDTKLGQTLVDQDRSLFYSKIIVARKKA
jgi:S-adenosylmethionine-diacylglycerol 3-amino-3-carboxypropyl transferase